MGSLGIFTGGLSYIAVFFGGGALGLVSDNIYNIIFNAEFKQEFLYKNNFIYNFIITNYLYEEIDPIIKKYDITCNKTLHIYNENVFIEKMNKIKDKLIEHKYLTKLRGLLTKTFNVLLVGGTNVGKSTLINEFLQLKDNEKAAESSGGPTETKDFTKYNGIFNGQNYSLYDSNGITNSGNDSIAKKIENTEKEIKKRINSREPNELIHCIWYCIQGSNIQPSDGDFIKQLFGIYEKYNMPIIFVHTQTYSKRQSRTSKQGLEKILLNIYKNQEIVDSLLNNYIDILARKDEDNNLEPFGLDKLELYTRREIRIKGHKSAFYEFIKKDIIPILVNGAFKLIFHDINLKRLSEDVTKNIDTYLNTMIDIINDDKLGLSDVEKNENEYSLNSIYDYYKKIKNEIKDRKKDILDINYLKEKYKDNIKMFYESKSNQYKQQMDYEKYKSYIEELIYYNLNKKSHEILNNIINLAFNNAILDKIKSSIREKFSKIEEEYITEIYNNLLIVKNEELKKNYD